MKNNLFSLPLVLVLLATVSVDAFAVCNVLRITTETSDQVIVHSDVSNCLPRGGSSESSGSQASVPEPTEEDRAAWVTFMANHCSATYNTLQEIEDANRYFLCRTGDFTELPAPAITSFVQGIDFYYKDLTSLDGLELVTHLPKLNIQYTDVTSLLPLSNVTNLTDLDVSRSSVLSLDGLEGMTSANKLYFDHTAVSNINALSNLQSVNVMRGYNTSVNSLAPLSSLTSANELNFYGAPLQSLEGLEGLTTIGTLTVSAGNFTDFKGLENLTSVTTTLDAGYNRNLVSLDGLENLRSVAGALNIRDATALDDIRALSGLESANQVWFYNSFPSHLGPTHRLPFDSSFCKAWRSKDIAHIVMSGNYNKICEEDTSENPESYWVRFVNDDCDANIPVGTVSDVESMSLQCRYPKTFTSLPTQPELTKINNMYFPDTNATTLVGMANVTTVGWLDLTRSGLTSLEGMNSVVTATTLNFTNNDIASVQGLDSLTTVGTLSLAANNISDLTGWPSIQSSPSIDLSSNNLSNIEGFQVMTSVGVLQLQHNNELTSIKGLDNLTSATSIDLRYTSLSPAAKLPFGSPFCTALQAGDLGTVSLDAGLTNDDICATEAASGQWLWAAAEYISRDSRTNVPAVQPSGACSVSEGYVHTPTFNQDAISITSNDDPNSACLSNTPYPNGQGVTGEASSEASTYATNSAFDPSFDLTGSMGVCHPANVYQCVEPNTLSQTWVATNTIPAESIDNLSSFAQNAFAGSHNKGKITSSFIENFNGGLCFDTLDRYLRQVGQDYVSYTCGGGPVSDSFVAVPDEICEVESGIDVDTVEQDYNMECYQGMLNTVTGELTKGDFLRYDVINVTASPYADTTRSCDAWTPDEAGYYTDESVDQTRSCTQEQVRTWTHKSGETTVHTRDETGSVNETENRTVSGTTPLYTTGQSNNCSAWTDSGALTYTSSFSPTPSSRVYDPNDYTQSRSTSTPQERTCTVTQHNDRTGQEDVVSSNVETRDFAGTDTRSVTVTESTYVNSGAGYDHGTWTTTGAPAGQERRPYSQDQVRTITHKVGASTIHSIDQTQTVTDYEYRPVATACFYDANNYIEEYFYEHSEYGAWDESEDEIKYVRNGVTEYYYRRSSTTQGGSPFTEIEETGSKAGYTYGTEMSYDYYGSNYGGTEIAQYEICE